MEQTFESKSNRKEISRRLGLSCISLLLVVVFTVTAGSNAVARIVAGAREVNSLVAWYVRSDQWRADARAYLTYAEFLFCPNSDAGSRLDEDEDE